MVVRRRHVSDEKTMRLWGKKVKKKEKTNEQHQFGRAQGHCVCARVCRVRTRFRTVISNRKTWKIEFCNSSFFFSPQRSMVEDFHCRCHISKCMKICSVFNPCDKSCSCCLLFVLVNFFFEPSFCQSFRSCFFQGNDHILSL